MDYVITHVFIKRILSKSDEHTIKWQCMCHFSAITSSRHNVTTNIINDKTTFKAEQTNVSSSTC